MQPDDHIFRSTGLDKELEYDAFGMFPNKCHLANTSLSFIQLSEDTVYFLGMSSCLVHGIRECWNDGIVGF